MNFENKLTIFEKTDTHRPINASKPKREIKQPKWTDNFISQERSENEGSL